MAKDFDYMKRPSGSQKMKEPKGFSELLIEFFEGDTPLAVAFRKRKTEMAAEAERESNRRLFDDIFPNTELGVDLKLMTRQSGRMPVGEYIDGVLTRDGEDHFLFVQNAAKERVAAHRNPHIYQGRYINVIRHADGSLVLTFNHPVLTADFTIHDFCREAAGELLAVAGLIGEE